MITQAGMERMLRALVEGPLMIALTAGDEEEDDTGYSRQPITFAPLGWDPERSTVYAINASEVRFPPYSRDATQPLTGYLIAREDGEPIAMGDLVRPRQPIARESIFFGSGDLRIELP